MESVTKLRQRQWSVVQHARTFRPVLVAGLGLLVVLSGLAGLNPAIGVACALLFLIAVLVIPRPVLIVYGLAFTLPLTGGIVRGGVIPFLRVGQALLVLGFVLFVLAKPSRQGKSLLSAIDLIFVLFFLAEAVFPMLALLYRGEHVDLNAVDHFTGSTPLQSLLGPIQYYLLYRIVVAIISSKEEIIVVLKVSFIASIIVSVIGIMQKLGVGPVRTLLATYYPSIALGDVVSNVDLRITSTLESYGGLAAYLCFTIILALACYAAQKRLKIPPLLLAVTILFDSIALILTGTFSAWIGLVIGGAIVFKLSGRLPKMVIFIVAGIVLAALIFQPFIADRITGWIGGGSAGGFLPSFAARIRLWRDLFLPAVGQNLLFGAGPAPAVLNNWPTEETQYLYLLLRGGIPYFVSYFLLIGAAVATCWRQIKSVNEGVSRVVAIATLAILVVINIMNISGAFFTNAGGTQTLWILLAIVVASGQLKVLGESESNKTLVNGGGVGARLPPDSVPGKAAAATLDASTQSSHVVRVQNVVRIDSLVPQITPPNLWSTGLYPPRFDRHGHLLDWRFVKDSAVVGAGSTFSRILGLLFWILLARFITPDDFGFVRYSITLAAIISVAATASPLSIARFLAANRDDPRTRDRYFSNGLVAVALVFTISLLLSVPILLLLHSFNIGTILCIVGLTGFFCYFAVARGMDDAWKMGLTYFLSNAVQIAVLIVVLGFLGLHTTTVALAIYGLTFLSPFVLELFRPTAVSFHLHLISRAVLLEMARFVLPVVLASGIYTFWYSFDLLLVENFNPQAVASYAAAKTLSGAFLFVPAAITSVLMPRVAALKLDKSRRYGTGAIACALLISLVGLAFVAVFGRELIALTFGHRYSDAYLPLLVLCAGMCIFSVYVVLEGFVLGRGRPRLSAQALLVAFFGTCITGFWLTIKMGALGASLSFTLGATLGSVFMLVTTLRHLRNGERGANNELSGRAQTDTNVATDQ